MQLGPIKITRSKAPALPLDSQATVVRQDKAIGASGTINTNGFLRPEEYNPDLQGRRWLDVADRMRRSDASVSEAEMHIKAPILNAEWNVEASGEDPEDLEAVAFVESVLFEWLRPSWSALLWQILLFLDHGRSVFELVEQVVEAELDYQDKDGNDVNVPSRQYVAWRSISHRLAHTIYKWNLDEYGDLASVTQIALGVDSAPINAEIPVERLAVFTYRMEGGDFEGLSILRPAYKAWTLKELVEKVSAIAVERHGAGIWVFYPPDGHQDDAELANRAEDILSQLRAGETSYLVSPYPKAKTGASTGVDPGCLFELLSPGGTLPDMGGLLAYHRGEIKAAVLARFSELGHGGTGARATGDTQSKVWRDALHGTAKLIEDVLNPLIARLVAKNFQVARPPMLRCGELDARSLAEFAVAVSQVVSSGAVEADQPFRNWVRTELGAPDEAEDTQQKIEDEEGVPVADPNDPAGDPLAPLPKNAPPTPEQQPGNAPKMGKPATEPATPPGEGVR